MSRRLDGGIKSGGAGLAGAGAKDERELIDELEAGELSVEFEGEEPEAVLEWAFERFAPRIAISTALQTDNVILIDLAYKLYPGDPGVHDRHRAPARRRATRRSKTCATATPGSTCAFSCRTRARPR